MRSNHLDVSRLIRSLQVLYRRHQDREEALARIVALAGTLSECTYDEAVVVARCLFPHGRREDPGAPPAQSDSEDASITGWCTVELLGHNGGAGWLEIVRVAGAKMFCLAIHDNSDHDCPAGLWHFTPAMVYRIASASEAECRKMGSDYVQPVARHKVSNDEPPF